ncbi:VOC family protein [Brevibacillus agri]|uniref:VOC family protein n=1 Tax=Brevibacillus agri TaxID=51101 RepID=UPI001EE5E219|nr:VOC family protein [Brevibacillus agri]MCG5249785.1 VOC family protein [Brevibacillus agri]MED1643170.1 VOC family protein [Brevibacillus agri]MED1656072.1 VOC family protein [Brevibacillus agri]MED1686207.1 VOC family protein [Brevibacillus agri]MED1690364.1 VOC family protein [Brevibacillus agri]
MLHHLELYVADLKRSAEFWGWLLEEQLGYERYQQWASGISWKHGNTYLVFVQAEERFLDVPYHRCRVGLNHLAFHARSREQVEAIHEELRRRGVPLLYEDRYPHAGGREHYALFCEDPDRIKVEIVAPE